MLLVIYFPQTLLQQFYVLDFHTSAQVRTLICIPINCIAMYSNFKRFARAYKYRGVKISGQKTTAKNWLSSTFSLSFF